MPARRPSPKAAKARKTGTAKAAAKPAVKAASRNGHARKAPAVKAVKAVKPAGKPGTRSAVKKESPAPKPIEMPLPKTPEVDEGDGLEIRPNLLAGPRNVRPYVVRKGEEYMSKEQLEHFRMILQSWKQDLMQEVDRTMLHMKDEAANFPDPNDRATQESEFSLELRTRDRERKLIRKIEEALKRIEDGSYGYCMETGEPIGIKRLEARPVATLSVEAQERRERREKQFGDRDDWYR